MCHMLPWEHRRPARSGDDGGECLCAPGGQEARIVRRRVHPADQRNFPESTDGE